MNLLQLKSVRKTARSQKVEGTPTLGKTATKLRRYFPIKSWELGWVMALVHCVNSAAHPHRLAASFNYTCFEPKFS